MTTRDTLIFIPTYDEHENVGPMCEQLLALPIPADIVFMDDNSPDGTGAILDRLAENNPRVSVIHRTGKLGIGNAHKEGIRYAYEHGYETLITMDCDFTHNPTDIARLLYEPSQSDITLGSRYLEKSSLPGWSPLRKFLTITGHFLTKYLLQMPYDATGAFRIYRISRIPREVFGLVTSNGYSFFFESLLILHKNGLSVAQVPIQLPARTYGHSKMSLREVFKSVQYLWSMYASLRSHPENFYLSRDIAQIDPALTDPQGWDDYWDKEKTGGDSLYGAIATAYRNTVIQKRLTSVIQRQFLPGAQLLHAGCGSGQVDTEIAKTMRISALDISVSALRLYQKCNHRAKAVTHGSILNLPFEAEQFDGVYNLGVLEHFEKPEIARILCEFHRVLKPGGKIVLFWPHAHASSVFVLNSVHWLLQRVPKKDARLHPAEVSLMRSRSQAQSLLEDTGFQLISYDFGVKDFFVQAIIVGQKP